jgi:hypothetical protein
MKNVHKQTGRTPAPRDCDAALAEFNATARPPLKGQIILSLKLFFIGGALMLTLWLVDGVVTR